jgi:hypothetical protein
LAPKSVIIIKGTISSGCKLTFIAASNRNNQEEMTETQMMANNLVCSFTSEPLRKSLARVHLGRALSFPWLAASRGATLIVNFAKLRKPAAESICHNGTRRPSLCPTLLCSAYSNLGILDDSTRAAWRSGGGAPSK